VLGNSTTKINYGLGVSLISFHLALALGSSSPLSKGLALPSTQTRELHTRGRVRIDPSDVCTCWLHLSLCLRRLGVPFIGTSGLGAVGTHLEGNSCFLSGGAPDSPVHHRTLSGARFPSKNGTVDRCRLGAVGAPDTHHRTVR
jgi:hypothetical protein